MSKFYCRYGSIGLPISSDKCTSRWPETVTCTIPISGIIDNIYYNIMILDGPEEDILNWAEENIGKVELMTIEEANIFGAQLIPFGTESKLQFPEGDITIIAGKFDIEQDPCIDWIYR